MDCLSAFRYDRCHNCGRPWNCVRTGAEQVPEKVSARVQELPLELAQGRELERLSEPEQSCNSPDCRQRAYTKPEQVPTNVLPERALQNAVLEQEPELLTEGLPDVPETFSAQGHDAGPEPYNAEAVGHIPVWEQA